MIGEKQRETLRDLPAYYTDEWLDQKVSEIEAAANGPGCASFVFITDIHVPSNPMNSKYLLKEITSRTSVQNVFFGGDAAYAYGTAKDCLDQAQAMIEYADYVGDLFFSVHGNHDYTIRTNPEEETGFTAQQELLYDLIMKRMEGRICAAPGKCYYYVDDAKQKVRYLILDAYERIASEDTCWGLYDYVSQEQYDWLIHDALNVQGYTIVAFAHAPADSKIEFSSSVLSPVADLFRAMNHHRKFFYQNHEISVNCDFSDATSVVSAYLCGHNHLDADCFEDGLLMISTTSDAPYQDDPKWKREAGTLTEQAFDVFTINTQERTVSAIRIGAGKNRSWRY